MRNGFTLIELLVVLSILVLVMGVIVPRGVKLLTSYQNSVNQVKYIQRLSTARNKAFLEAKTINISISGKYYMITSRGIVHEETSNDNY